MKEHWANPPGRANTAPLRIIQYHPLCYRRDTTDFSTLTSTAPPPPSRNRSGLDNVKGTGAKGQRLPAGDHAPCPSLRMRHKEPLIRDWDRIAARWRHAVPHGLNSLTPGRAGEARLLGLVGGQSIIKGLRYIPDATYDEDRCRICTGDMLARRTAVLFAVTSTHL